MSEIKPVVIIKTAEQRIDAFGNFAVTNGEHVTVYTDRNKAMLLATKEEAAELRAAYEALQKENAELRDRITIMDEAAKYYNETIIGISNKLHAENEALKLKKEFIEYAAQDLENQNEALKAENEAQAKRIAELEAATEHLGLTPQQAKDGLARHKAQVAEIEALRKQVDEHKEWHMIRDEMRKALEAQMNG